jgi:hypothetical protein
MFTTNGVEVKVNESASNNYIQPGIVTASIASIDTHTSAQGNVGLRLNFVDENGATAEKVYYVTDKEVTKTIMIEKVIGIAVALGVKEQVDNIKSPNLKEYAMELNDILTGKPARFKFTGKQVQGKNGLWWKADLAFFDFVESLSVEPSNLKFNASNTRDMTYLEEAPATTENNSASGTDW